MKIGIDLGGSHIAVGLVDNENHIVAKKEYNWTEEEKNNLAENIEKYCKKMIKEIMEENNLLQVEKIGIGYPAKRIINGTVYLNHTEPFPLAEMLSKAFQVKTYLKNDVKCSSLCEKKMGNLKPYNHCIFMTLGTGIGGAYFYQNEQVVPNQFQGFEVGHMIIQANGKQCRCGQKGCFEEYASMRVFRKQVETLLNIKNLTSDKMFEILKNKQKEKEINQIIENYIDYLAIGMINLINIFEPDAICLGGSFSYYAPIFMDQLKQKLQNNFQGRTIPDLLIAKYANDAGIIGASMLESN